MTTRKLTAAIAAFVLAAGAASACGTDEDTGNEGEKDREGGVETTRTAPGPAISPTDAEEPSEGGG